MQKSVLVTGGAGFIGSHLVDALVASGHIVRVFDNLEPQVHGGLREQGQWPDYGNPEAEYVLGDVRDREALARALQDIDVVFHQAAMVGVGQSMYEIERYVDVNSRGTAMLLDVIVNERSIRRRVRKLVVASSMSIYGEGAYSCPTHGVVYPHLRRHEQLAAREWNPRCPIPACNQTLRPQPTAEGKPLHANSIYALSKKDQEEMSLAVGRAYDLPVVALRYFNAYGPRQALSNPYTGVAAIFASRLMNEKPPVIFEDGRQQRDFVSVSDLVQANLLAMERDAMDYSTFNVASGQPTTISDVAEILIDLLEKPIQPQITEQFRTGDIRHCVADIEKIQAHGFQPTISLRDGFAELVAWLNSQTAADHFEAARRELERRGLAT